MTLQLKPIAPIAVICLSITAIAGQEFSKTVTKPDKNGKSVEIINGVRQDVDIAKLKDKAESGDAEAQTSLAVCLYDGKHGISIDHAEAYKWATVASSQNQKAAKYLVQELEIFSSPKELTEGREAAKAFIQNQKGSKR
jgi:TPR repeat protein